MHPRPAVQRLKTIARPEIGPFEREQESAANPFDRWTVGEPAQPVWRTQFWPALAHELIGLLADADAFQSLTTRPAGGAAGDPEFASDFPGLDAAGPNSRCEAGADTPALVELQPHDGLVVSLEPGIVKRLAP